MAEGRGPQIDILDLSFNHKEENLDKLLLHSVTNAGINVFSEGPDETVNDFVSIISERYGGKVC